MIAVFCLSIFGVLQHHHTQWTSSHVYSTKCTSQIPATCHLLTTILCPVSPISTTAAGKLPHLPTHPSPVLKVFQFGRRVVTVVFPIAYVHTTVKMWGQLSPFSSTILLLSLPYNHPFACSLIYPLTSQWTHLSLHLNILSIQNCFMQISVSINAGIQTLHCISQWINFHVKLVRLHSLLQHNSWWYQHSTYIKYWRHLWT